ncbi:MAG: hypothetical protein WBB82_07915 [Limnothrix sp.]
MGGGRGERDELNHGLGYHIRLMDLAGSDFLDVLPYFNGDRLHRVYLLIQPKSRNFVGKPFWI